MWCIGSTPDSVAGGSGFDCHPDSGRLFWTPNFTFYTKFIYVKSCWKKIKCFLYIYVSDKTNLFIWPLPEFIHSWQKVGHLFQLFFVEFSGMWKNFLHSFYHLFLLFFVFLSLPLPFSLSIFIFHFVNSWRLQWGIATFRKQINFTLSFSFSLSFLYLPLVSFAPLFRYLILLFICKQVNRLGWGVRYMLMIVLKLLWEKRGS